MGIGGHMHVRKSLRVVIPMDFSAVAGTAGNVGCRPMLPEHLHHKTRGETRSAKLVERDE